MSPEGSFTNAVRYDFIYSFNISLFVPRDSSAETLMLRANQIRLDFEDSAYRQIDSGEVGHPCQASMIWFIYERNKNEKSHSQSGFTQKIFTTRLAFLHFSSVVNH